MELLAEIVYFKVVTVTVIGTVIVHSHINTRIGKMQEVIY